MDSITSLDVVWDNSSIAINVPLWENYQQLLHSNEMADDEKYDCSLEVHWSNNYIPMTRTHKTKHKYNVIISFNIQMNCNKKTNK